MAWFGEDEGFAAGVALAVVVGGGERAGGTPVAAVASEKVTVDTCGQNLRERREGGR